MASSTFQSLTCLVVILVLVAIQLCSLPTSVHACGYQTCPQSYTPNKIHLHIISHSHDDVGWLKTPDGYFDEDVTNVITNVVDALQKNPKRKFVQVETYYFRRWWQRQTLATHEIVQNLVKSGQFTFANGGWCVNDEAAAHYSPIIDQMTLGIQFLRDTFGECVEPKLSWQIDPFGASREMANLFAQMGFDAHVVNRGDQLRGEFIWNTSESHSIFTTHLHNHYSAPDGFNFEDDGNQLTDANKHDKAKKLVELGKQWNKDYGSKGHVLITFGDDFRYQNAEKYFSNLDKLIEVVNSDHPDVELLYSSPICYVKAIRDLKPKLEIKSRDYFPLWTGYFTSRPLVKYLDRHANNLLQAAKQLEVLSGLSHTEGLVFEAKNEQAVLQHHDAITGTARVAVNEDYKKRLVNGIKASTQVISQAIGKLIHNQQQKIVNMSWTPLVYSTVNISDFTAHLHMKSFAIIIYNPLVHEQNVWIRIPVSNEHAYKLYDYQQKDITQKMSTVAIVDKVKQLIGHHQEITHELVFEAKLPPLGYTTYLPVKQIEKLAENKQLLPIDAYYQDYVLQGKNFQLVIDHKSGQVKQLIRVGNDGGGNRTHRLEQKFMYYESRTTSSYEFCPTSGAIDLTNYDSVLVSAGKYAGFVEVTQKVNDWIWQTVRVYEDKEYVEFDWIVGPVSDEGKIGKNVITRFVTDLNTDGIYYTDANGRQNMRRQRNNDVRGCDGINSEISYNYYPITTRAMLEDVENDLVLSVLTDHSVGAASIEDGSIELMIHRREFAPSDIPLNDLDSDGKGVVARGKNLVFFTTTHEAADQYRQQSQTLFMQPVVLFDSAETVANDVAMYSETNQLHFSALKSPLPDNVHLLTLENWGPYHNNEILVRLENFYQSTDQSVLVASTNVSSPSIPLDVFENVQIEQIFKSNLIVGERSQLSLSSITNVSISLAPQEIQNFIYKVSRPSSNNGCKNLSWKKLINRTTLPQHAILAGNDNDHDGLYICRHKNADLIPGKFDLQIRCRISYGGHEITYDDDDVEILTTTETGTGDIGAGIDYQWVPRHGGDSVSNNVYNHVGDTATGLPIYIGRCMVHGVQVGKIDEYFYYAYNGAELKDCVDHEILTC